MRPTMRVMVWLWSVVLLGACGSDAGVTIKMRVSADAPAYGETPFPTDAVREGDRLGVIAGLDTLVSNKAELVTAQVAALDGFGLRPLVELFVDGALDPTSVPAHTTSLADAAVLVDVDPASPEHGRVIAMDWRYDAARAVLAGSPASGQVLREGTRYAAFVTTALRAADGEPLRRTSALDRLDAHARWRTTAEALRELDGDRRIAALTVFTTQRATAPLVAARAAMQTAPAPVLAVDPELVFAGRDAIDRVMGVATRATDGPRAGLERWGNDNPTGVAHDHVGVVATGTMTVVRFRGRLPGDHLWPRARRRPRSAAGVRRAADRHGLRAGRHRHGRARLALRRHRRDREPLEPAGVHRHGRAARRLR